MIYNNNKNVIEVNETKIIKLNNIKNKKNISNDELKDLILDIFEMIKFEIDKLK